MVLKVVTAWIFPSPGRAWEFTFQRAFSAAFSAAVRTSIREARGTLLLLYGALASVAGSQLKISLGVHWGEAGTNENWPHSLSPLTAKTRKTTPTQMQKLHFL